MILKTCSWLEDGEQCGSLCEGSTDYCGSHNYRIRKEAKQANKIQVIRQPQKVSVKRAKQLEEYYRLEAAYLKTHPCCEVRECHNKSNQIHHMEGRENEKLLDVNLFLGVCYTCHRKITDDSAWAIEQGYSLQRTKTQTI